LVLEVRHETSPASLQGLDIVKAHAGIHAIATNNPSQTALDDLINGTP
jgi:hypothetical protein